MTDSWQGLEIYRGTVKPEWIDVNGHMNVAYYVLAFDQAVDSLWTRIGITADYVAETRGSTFAVESHVTWQRELRNGDPFVITSQIVAFDQKRIHQFQRLYHAKERYLAATAEWMNLHVDLTTRRVSSWSADTIESIYDVVEMQGDASRPAELGSRMTIKQPLYSIG